jgi:probable phosphoglycerate mutase
MRHGAVAYFTEDGRPVAPDDVPLTEEGREQALAARALLADVRLDRVLASGLPRTSETAALVSPEHDVEVVPELREITGSKLSSIPAAELEEAFVHAFRGVVPNEKRFLGGETIGALFDRIVPALERLVAETGIRRSSSRTVPSTGRSSPTR